MEDKRATLEKAVDTITHDFMVFRYLYRSTWISGSTTEVYPVTIWTEDGEIVVQTRAKKNIFEKTIKRIIRRSKGDIIYGYYNQKDGSCSNTLHFFVKGSWKGEMFVKNKKQIN